VVVTGASFGGYHATNFALKYPEVVRRVVSMSGAYDIRCFLDGYFDENCYFNSPFDYLSNLTDEAYLGEFRHGIEWVLAAGEHDICLGANRHMSDLFHAKQIPHTLDIWGQGAVHDWPLWRQMVRKYFN
jgi:esterase/lipase superfamily enzyme